MKRFLLLIIFCLGALGIKAARVENLRCEYVVDPLGVDTPSPRLSWVMTSERRADIQRAYRILVASSLEKLAADDADCWDTGKINSDQSTQINYQGKPLLSGKTYFWKVAIWNGQGKASAWSEPACWTMGLLSAEAWHGAQWIAYKRNEQWQQEWTAHKERELSDIPPLVWPNTSWPWLTGKDSTIFTLHDMANPKYDPAPLFRKHFAAKRGIAKASLYICGLGYYEAFINGKRVGNHVLDPAWTVFDKRVLYSTYDVTHLLQCGENAMGVMLGRGQYNPLCNDIWGLYKASWVDQPKLIALLKIEYADGTISHVITDERWKTHGGPIIYDDTRHGELYDARLEQDGWSENGFSDNHWKLAHVVPFQSRLESQMIPPIRCFAPLQPVKTIEKSAGITVYDIGQNIAGWARISVQGPQGAKVLIEYAETPNDPDLVPNLTPFRLTHSIKDPHYASFYDKCLNIRQQNGYILRGGGVETFECHFSYKGFQYIRVTADEGVQVAWVEGVPVHTDLEQAGSFVCSAPAVNQIQDAAVRSLLNNSYGIFTDCPHREKQGWTADNSLSSRAAIYNFNMAGFYSKWIQDLADTQSPKGGLGIVAPASGDQDISTTWPAAIVYIPWDLYRFYGDTRLLEEQWEVMSRFAKSSLFRQIEGKPEIIQEVLGDWLSPIMVIADSMARKNIMAPPEGLTYYGTAAHYLVVRRLAEICRVIGKEAETEELDAWAGRIAQNFNREFFDPSTNTYHGDQPTGYRQSPNIVALDYGLVPEDREEAVLRRLEQDINDEGGHLSTGFLGTASLMEYLPRYNPQLAFDLAMTPEYPSWGYMARHGANALWESWDGYDSHSHPSFCVISEYFYKYLAGIQFDPLASGFKKIVIDPSFVNGLSYVKAHHDALIGRIESRWKRNGNQVELIVTIPANTRATVFLLTTAPDEITESGKSIQKREEIKQLGYDSLRRKAILEIGSGTYTFLTTIPETN